MGEVFSVKPSSYPPFLPKPGDSLFSPMNQVLSCIRAYPPMGHRQIPLSPLVKGQSQRYPFLLTHIPELRIDLARWSLKLRRGQPRSLVQGKNSQVNHKELSRNGGNLFTIHYLLNKELKNIELRVRMCILSKGVIYKPLHKIFAWKQLI